MSEALRLTRAGRLGEATAAIQRSLGGSASQTMPPHDPAPIDETVEGRYRVVHHSIPALNCLVDGSRIMRRHRLRRRATEAALDRGGRFAQASGTCKAQSLAHFGRELIVHAERPPQGYAGA